MEYLSNQFEEIFDMTIDEFIDKNMKRIFIFLFALMIGMVIGVSGVKAATKASPTPSATPKVTGPVPIVVGTVSAAPTTTIAVTDASGQSHSFTLDPKTIVEAPSIASIKGKPALKNIAAGDQVAVVSSDQTTTGLIILSAKGSQPATTDSAFLGVVSSRDATTSGTILSMKHPTQDTFAKALIGSKTQLAAQGIAKPTVDDIRAGDIVLVVGPIDKTNLITAISAYLIPGQARALIDKLAPLATGSASASSATSSKNSY